MTNIIIDEFVNAMEIPKYKSLEAFLENGFELTANDRFKRFDITLAPWCRTLAQWFEDPDVKNIYLVMCSQVSKTSFMIGALLYISQFVKGAVPAMWVHNTGSEAKKFVKRRLIPLIQGQADFYKNDKERWDSGGFNFFNSYLKIGYGSTKDSMASDPCRYVFGDEGAKWKESTSYPKLRIRTFEGLNPCCVFASTPPATPDHHFIQESKAGNFYRWFVPCPHCGEYQAQIFTNLRFDQRDETKSVYDQEKIRQTAAMKCVACGEKWHDKHKLRMINKGKPVCVDRLTGEPLEEIKSDTKTLQVSALYTTFTSYGQLAVNFINAKMSGKLALQNFITDELGEFLEAEGGFSFKESELTRYIDYSRKLGTLRPDLVLHTVGIDIQRRGDAYVVLMGYKSDEGFISGHVIQYGCVRWKDDKGLYRWEEIMAFLEPYERVISRICVDATDGVLQADIFDFCYKAGAKYLPLRDAANQTAKFIMKSVEDMPSYQTKMRHRSGFRGQQYLSVNSALYKNEFVSAMGRNESQGAWSFPVDSTKEFFLHLQNEKRVEEKNKMIWRPKYSGAPQHYFSALIYSMCGMDLYRHVLQNNRVKKRGQR